VDENENTINCQKETIDGTTRPSNPNSKLFKLNAFRWTAIDVVINSELINRNINFSHY